MRRIARPLSRGARSRRWIVGFGADIHALRGLVEDQHATGSSSASGAARLSAGCRLTACAWRPTDGGRMSSSRMNRWPASASASAIEPSAQPRELRQRREREVRSVPERADDAVLAAVLGHVRETGRDRVCRRGDRPRCAVQADLGLIGRREAEQGARELGAAGADEATEARRSRRHAR